MQMSNLKRCQVCSDCRRFRRATAPAPNEFRDIAGDLRPRLEERATTPNWPMKTDLFCWALTKGHSGQLMRLSCSNAILLCRPAEPKPSAIICNAPRSRRHASPGWRRDLGAQACGKWLDTACQTKTL